VEPAPPPAAPPAFPRRRSRRALLGVLALLLALAVPPALALLLWTRCGLGGCPDVGRLAAFRPGGAPVVLDRHGEPIGELGLAEQPLVELAALPPHVPEAFLAVEDKRFRQHRGVDWTRVAGAAIANLRAGEIRQGSSTLTMQLARNVFADRLEARRRTLARKLLEARVALAIERAYDKDEILELYLNHIYFGGGQRGIAAAAQHYFRKRATELTLREAALLAALPKAPTHYDPREHPERARERRDLVLTLMAEQGRIPAAEAAAARERSLGVARRGRTTGEEPPFAGWFLERVRAELEDAFGEALYREPVRVVTTLDRAAQEAAERELARQLAAIERGAYGRFSGPRYDSDDTGDEDGTDYLQGALVLLEAGTGDVLAWVGGRDFEHSRFDRVADARRQVGSAFKPFVHAAALAGGTLPSERFSDLPLTVQLAGGRSWEPRNFDGSYAPSVTLREALVHSRNLATVRVAERAGMEEVAALAADAGLTGVEPVPAAALGTHAVSPLQLAAAYVPFATLGGRPAPRLVLRVEDAAGEALWQAEPPRLERALDPAVAFVVTDMLREAALDGTGRAASAAAGGVVPLAGKTGTTNDHHDVWFAGFTPDVVGAVWMGFDRPRLVTARASGGTLAAPVFGRVIRELYRGRPHPGGWPPPDGVVIAAVDPATGYLLEAGCASGQGSRTEVFLEEHLPPARCPGREPDVWARFFGWLPRGAPPPAPAGPREEVVVIPEDEIGSDGRLSPSAERRLRRAEERLRERVQADEGKEERKQRRGKKGGRGRARGRGPD
jgi:penicillin-binding protein 1A